MLGDVRPVQWEDGRKMRMFMTAKQEIVTEQGKNPHRYLLGDETDVIDQSYNWYGIEGFMAYNVMTVQAYLARTRSPESKESMLNDLRKARNTLDRMIEQVEEEEFAPGFFPSPKKGRK